MLTRKQRWRKQRKGKSLLFTYDEHHANNFQKSRKLSSNIENSTTYSNRPISNGSVTALDKISPLQPSKKLSKPLKSCLSNSNLFDLANEATIDKDNSETTKLIKLAQLNKPKKKVKFSLVIKVCLVYERKELMPLANDLFWTPQDCDRFKKDAFIEVIKCKNRNGCTAKEAIVLMYQPGNDHILLEVVEMIESKKNEITANVIAVANATATATSAMVATKTSTDDEKKAAITNDDAKKAALSVPNINVSPIASTGVSPTSTSNTTIESSSTVSTPPQQSATAIEPIPTIPIPPSSSQSSLSSYHSSPHASYNNLNASETVLDNAMQVLSITDTKKNIASTTTPSISVTEPTVPSVINTNKPVSPSITVATSNTNSINSKPTYPSNSYRSTVTDLSKNTSNPIKTINPTSIVQTKIAMKTGIPIPKFYDYEDEYDIDLDINTIFKVGKTDVELNADKYEHGSDGESSHGVSCNPSGNKTHMPIHGKGNAHHELRPWEVVWKAPQPVAPSSHTNPSPRVPISSSLSVNSNQNTPKMTGTALTSVEMNQTKRVFSNLSDTHE